MGQLLKGEYRGTVEAPEGTDEDDVKLIEKKATREPKTIDIRDYSGKLYTSDLRGFGICGDKIFIGAIDAKVFMFDLS